MRGMNSRSVIASLGIAALLPLGSAAADPARHDARVADPTGSVEARAWVQPGGDGAGSGSSIDIAPQAPQAPPILGQLQPDPSDPSEPPGPPEPPLRRSPLVEAPDLGPGPHLPDLAPLPAWDIYVDESVIGTTAGDYAIDTLQGNDPFAGSQRAIRFGATIANLGDHSLEIVGVPEPGEGEEPARVRAFQCVQFAGPRIDGSGRVCQSYQPVGSLSLHPQHGHFHIDGFAQYRLLRDAGGKPNTSAVVARSEKVGFCMRDTDWLRDEPFVADTGWYRECRHTAPHVPVTARQGVSPGWGDSYGSGLPGQHLVIEGVPDGVYWIAITVNPPAYADLVKIHETTRANNTSYRRIKLHEGGTKVTPL
jgi:hypothetical protein